MSFEAVLALAERALLGLVDNVSLASITILLVVYCFREIFYDKYFEGGKNECWPPNLVHLPLFVRVVTFVPVNKDKLQEIKREKQVRTEGFRVGIYTVGCWVK